MKSSPYPMRKRLTALLLVLILCLSSSGSAAFAEEFFLWEEEPAEVSFEPELFEELIEEEAVEDNPCEEELILFEDASPADTAEADAEELFFEVEQDTFEAAPEQTFLAGETAVFEAQPQPEAVPGTVRLAAGADLFPAGASLSVTPLPQAEAAETLTLDDSESFDSAEAESEDSSDAEVPDDLIYDEAIPDGDEILLVNPRRASDVNANCSVTTEAVASYRYEISMLSPEGEALQPPEGERVTLAFDLPEASDESLDVKVLYLPASGAEEELPARVEDGTVYAETSGFSTFVVNFSRTERLYTATSSVPTPVKNIVDSVVTEEKNLYVVYAYSSHPNLVKVFKDMDIWFVEAPWVFDETVTLTVGTSPWEGDVSATAEYTITVKSHLPGIPYRKLGESLECTKYTLMSSIKEQMGMTLKDGWYIVDKDVTFEKHRLTVLGDVHLILRDGCTLTCKYGIRTATNVDPNTALTVYAEDQGTGLLRCEVNYDRRTTESFYAGIGGNRNEDCGVVTVYGGEIKAVGAIQGAGIGGGTGGNLRGFTMYDGTVTVKGKKGAGVGGGKGGTITGPIAVHGGLLTATSLSNDAQDPTNYSAAIGAGEDKNLGADIIIDGGVVIAQAKNGGAGIGDSGITSGGKRINDNGSVSIKGGHVIASATDGAGIGAGMNGVGRGGTGCTVNISGGFVEAVSSKRGAGIGGSFKGDGGVVNISGGYVIARGTDLKVPFGHGHKWITAEKQTSAARAGLEAIGNLLVEAFSRHEYGGAGIGGGDGGNGGTVTISGGTILAASGGNGSQAIGHGMEGESNGTAAITNDHARIQYGWDMEQLNESKRKDVYGWNDITREKRSNWLTNNTIVYIFPCEHEEMVYRPVDRDHHERVCQTCLYYERGEAHDFDEKGLCRKCLYNRNNKPVEYNVWYLGTRITSENMERTHYDPFTNTLTIPDKVDWNLLKPLYNGALIYAEGDLNISGNAWVSPKDNPAKYGVYVKGGTVTFKEGSELSFTASEYGLYAPDGLKIENVKALGFTAGEGGTGVYFGDKPPVVNENVGLKAPAYGKAGSGAIVDKDGKNAAAVNFVRGLTLSFDASGAVGTPEPMKGLVKNMEYTLPEGKPRRQNYDFLDWDINGTLYDVGMSFSISEDTTAKAVWQEHAHNWKAPIWEWTQDENGRMLATAQFVCSDCNELSQVAASVFASTTEASCEKAGSIRYLASVRAIGGENGEYNDTKIVTLPALGHKWGEWAVTKEATTEDPGEMTRVCANDPAHVEHKLIPQLHTHSLIKMPRVEPICVTAGNIEYWKCTGCGEYFADADGKNRIEKESVILPATGQHQPAATTTVTQEATCTERKEYQYRVRCKDCGQLLEGRNDWDFPLGHDWGDWTVTKAASETEDGEETRICRRDPSHVERRIIPRLAHVHSLVKTEAAAASCTEPGNIAFWTCSGCGRLFADSAGTQEITQTAAVINPLGHKAADAWIGAGITKQPTCTERGFESMELRCARCGEVLSVRDRALDSLGHDWGAWTVTKAASEDEEGSEQRVCARDASHIETRAIPRLQHVHSLRKTEAAAPACTAPGNCEYWTCLGCGRLFADAEGKNEINEADTVIPAAGHRAEDEWSETVVTEASCEGTGRKKLTLLCRDCGEVLSRRSVSIPALGHDWGDWTVTKEATETQEGEERRVCSRDGNHIEKRIVPATGHVHELFEIEERKATCTEDGNIAYWKCSGCGLIFSDQSALNMIDIGSTVIPALGHTPEEEWRPAGKRTEPGCTTPGEESFERLCTRCGMAADTKTEIIPATGHLWGDWETLSAATEDVEGSEQRICRHDPSHTEMRVIPRKPHEHRLTKTEAAEPGCETPGNSEYWTCLGCGKLFADAEGKNGITEADTVLPAKGHTPKAEWDLSGSLAPTCEAEGLDSYEKHCSVCGAVLETRTERVPALGHAWGAWTVTKAATEEDSGIETRTCARCGKAEQHTIPKLAHRHSMTKIDAVKPTCTETGSIAYYRCSGCGRLFADAAGKTEIYESDILLPANGHSAAIEWQSDAVTKQPGCTDQGFRRMKLICADCGEELSSRGESIAPLGHDWGEWETTLEPTETQEGRQIRVCLNDERHVEERALPVLTHTHTLAEIPAKEARCVEPGSSACYQCTGCGLYFADAAGTQPVEPEDMVIEALGHTAGAWSDGTIEKSAKCTEIGIRSYTLSCARCGEALTTRTERIPALGHDWGAWVTAAPATEDTEGTEIRTCAHDASHTETRTTPRLPHTHRLEAVPGIEPKCVDPGSIAYWTCQGCDRLFSDAEGKKEIGPDALTLPPKGHTAAADWVSEKEEPNCTTPGFVRFTLSCADCGETLSTRGSAIPALGHDWGAWKTVKAPTEAEDGEEQRVCLRDPAHVQSRVVPALGHTHTMTLVPEKAASCTEEGSRAYYLCTGCGLCFEDELGKNWLAPEDIVIAPLGHRAGEWQEESRTAPGCTQPGVKTLQLHCADCGTVLTTRSEIIPAVGHDWGKATYLWSDDLSMVIAERLCRNDPSHMQQEICGEIEIKTAVPAGCEDEGTALYRAVFENPAFDSEKTRGIPALGHKWGAWTVTRAATETEDGEQTRVCENDSTHIQTAVIPSLTHVHKLTAVPEKKPGC